MRACSSRSIARRSWLRRAGVAAACLAGLSRVRAAQAAEGAPASDAGPKSAASPLAAYETHAQGIRILPGAWRPHYPWEHIAWISPSWPSQDYIWLDFPEAVFTAQGLQYLSHVNPPIPTLFSDLPAVPWRRENGGIAFDRELPNGVAFGSRATPAGDMAVDLEIYIRNGTREPLTDIRLQTCAFLRAIREFADYTQDNKFVHLPDEGWVPIGEVGKRDPATAKGRYGVGWRTRNKRFADLPVIVTLSNAGDRLFAMSWGKDTLSMVSNPNHPCAHADPTFADLEPGATGRVRGRLAFFEGRLEDFRAEEHFEGL
jgi:hypothetical protein